MLTADFVPCCLLCLSRWLSCTSQLATALQSIATLPPLPSPRRPHHPTTTTRLEMERVVPHRCETGFLVHFSRNKKDILPRQARGQTKGNRKEDAGCLTVLAYLPRTACASVHRTPSTCGAPRSEGHRTNCAGCSGHAHLDPLCSRYLGAYCTALLPALLRACRAG